MYSVSVSVGCNERWCVEVGICDFCDHCNWKTVIAQHTYSAGSKLGNSRYCSYDL